jgi:hypothetical protein
MNTTFCFCEKAACAFVDEFIHENSTGRTIFAGNFALNLIEAINYNNIAAAIPARERRTVRDGIKMNFISNLEKIRT